MYSVENLGTCYFLLNVYLIQLAIWGLAGCFKDRSALIEKYHKKYEKVLFWGTLLRLLFEGYLELCLSVFVSLTDMEWSGENYNSSVLYCNIFTIALSCLLVGMPPFIYIFYTCYAGSMDDEEF